MDPVLTPASASASDALRAPDRSSRAEGRAPRRYPVGAEVVAEGVSFRVWASRRRRVSVVVEDAGEHALQAEDDGYFSAVVDGLPPEALYRYRLDGGDKLCPDPASRYQPQGPHGPSQVVNPRPFAWTDARWKGVAPHRRVVYELHVGTFTREGTWAAAEAQLEELARIGITVIEIMPLAEFPGRFGWGYDGVGLYAPTRLYGTPDDFRRFVDRAHASGIAVILDVVYNHFGPDGCYLREFSLDYFTNRYENDWGEPVNYDGKNSQPVREFITANAAYWIDEFHLDGLRLDATQQLFDASPRHIIAAVVEQVRAAAPGRSTYVLCENEPQDVRLVLKPTRGGYGADAVWNDDFHHSALVALTGRNEAYYTDYGGQAQELVSAAKWGYLYQGQPYRWQKKARGTSTLGVPAAAFVHYLENHDQLANSARGARTHQLTSPGRHRALTAALLLGPQTPLLFQGQEFSASSPFLFFADHKPDLAAAVRTGRRDFLRQFPGIATREVQDALAEPADRDTFERCKLDLAERVSHASAYALHVDLLRLRHSDPVFCGLECDAVDGAVLSSHAFVLRYFARDGRDRLLLVNYGMTLSLSILPEPLLAPPARSVWHLRWASEEFRYGGSGVTELETEAGWRLPGEAAIVLAAEDGDPSPDRAGPAS